MYIIPKLRNVSIIQIFPESWLGSLQLHLGGSQPNLCLYLIVFDVFVIEVPGWLSKRPPIKEDPLRQEDTTTTRLVPTFSPLTHKQRKVRSTCLDSMLLLPTWFSSLSSFISSAIQSFWSCSTWQDLLRATNTMKKKKFPQIEIEKATSATGSIRVLLLDAGKFLARRRRRRRKGGKYFHHCLVFAQFFTTSTLCLRNFDVEGCLVTIFGWSSDNLLTAAIF